MCGITGIYSLNGRCIDSALLRKMTVSLVHRGPDDEGFFINSNIGLGHRRLSIIDITHGKQPYYNEKGDVIAICNGELYNFLEIKKNLIKMGHIFNTHCDIEILPHLYEEKGIDFLAELNGMFALAIYDAKKNQLFLARDRVGIKTIFYGIYDDILRFGSEIKAILQDKSFPRVINSKSLHDFLTLSYFLPPETFFDSIKELEAGCYLKIFNNKIEQRRWWEFKIENYTRKNNRHNHNIYSRYKEILINAIRNHLIADVSIGALLSGGIDSSLVTAIASIVHMKKLKTFNVKFPEKKYDESKHALCIANKYKTKHFTNELNFKEGFPELIEKVILLFDQPFGDTSSLPCYLIFREIAKNGVKVVLSGDGGDELFCGYSSYRQLAILKIYRLLPGSMKKIFNSLINKIASVNPILFRKIKKGIMISSLSIGERILALKTYYSEYEKQKIYTSEWKIKLGPISTLSKLKTFFSGIGFDDIDAMNAFNWRYSLNADMLRKIDITSMAHGLEVRVPFLENESIAFSASLSNKYKIHMGTTKYFLKKFAKGYLPKNVLKHRKQGFEIPLDSWANESFIDYLKNNLLKNDYIITKIINKKEIEYLIDRFRFKSDDAEQSRYQNYQRLYMLLSIELCAKKWGCILKA